MRWNRHAQFRALGEQRGQAHQFFALRRQQAAGGRFEQDGAGLVAVAAEQAPQHAERRRDDAAQDIADGLPDDGTDAELRIVQAAGDRHIEIDAAVRLLEQRDRQGQWNIQRGRTFHALAQCEALEHDAVVALDHRAAHAVVEIQRDASVGDAITGETHGVRRRGGQIDVAQLHAEGGAIARRVKIDGAGQARKAELAHLAIERELTARIVRAGQAVGGAGQFGDVGDEFRLDVGIGEFEAPLRDAHAAHVQRQCRRGIGRGRGGGRHRSRCRCRARRNNRRRCRRRRLDHQTREVAAAILGDGKARGRGDPAHFVDVHLERRESETQRIRRQRLPTRHLSAQ